MSEARGRVPRRPGREPGRKFVVVRSPPEPGEPVRPKARRKKKWRKPDSPADLTERAALRCLAAHAKQLRADLAVLQRKVAAVEQALQLIGGTVTVEEVVERTLRRARGGG